MACFKLLTLILAAFMTTVVADCNPLTQNSCAAIPGLATSSYTIDFTQQKSLPSDWILAGAANVTFGSKGAEFNFNKRKDAPYIWTNFYVAYGKIDVELQVASGTGTITSAVMFSDDADEIDWEFSGSNLGAGPSHGKGQTNVFGKGMTGNYDRGTLQDISSVPQTNFHIYSFDWTPDKIDWIIDGVVKYTTKNTGQTTGNYQFPQTPSRLHLGMWDAGDPDTAAGTRNWAGGYTDYSKVPYIAYVKSVKITTPYPCKAWKYPDDFSGSWADVKCTNETISASATSSKTSSAPASTYTSSTYTVEAGDNGYSIADKLGCSFEQLSAANPGVAWDFLNVGQKLNNPYFSNTTASGSTTISNTANSTSTKASSSTSQVANSLTSSNTGSENTIVPITFKLSTSSMQLNSTINTNLKSATGQRRTSATPSSTRTASSMTSKVTSASTSTSTSTTTTTTTTTTANSASSSMVQTSSSTGAGWSYAGNNFAGFGPRGWHSFYKDATGRSRKRREDHQPSRDTLKFGRLIGGGRHHV